ncbi:MAG: peptidase and chymotrypsin/Hap [Conexibacter sp.]|nr:peptidase and chymotrypsin/Hap [Conexibacter sp.]
MRARAAIGGVTVALALAAAGCGGSSSGGLAGDGGTRSDVGVTRTATTRVEVVEQQGQGGFDASALYARDAEGVVTVVSVFDAPAGTPAGHPASEGLGSGFVVSSDGQIVTNAHVVSNGTGTRAKRAKSVYVQFGDGNQVPATIVGTDLNADVALIKVAPAGLTLRPLTIGTNRGLVVGTPVAAIGSPFGEPQSLSVGVISATNRSIDSLNSGGSSSGSAFAIQGAIQTDAAINHGNSGGPLVDARGRVIGINAQIQSTGGGGEGVGFAIPADTVKRSLGQLREKGSVDYAYLGVQTVSIYPQLAEAFNLPVGQGALVQLISADSPAARAGLHGPTRRGVTFQASQIDLGGDVVAKVDGRQLTRDYDLATAIQDRTPGATVTLLVYRDGTPRQIPVQLGSRPG